MNSKRPLAPAFINKLDQYLLLHHPAIWSTRIHLVTYYVGLFSLFLAVISFIVPNDARNYTNIEVYSTLISLVSVIGIIFWVIYLLRFNVFKRFGIQSRGIGVLTFLCYFFTTALFVAAPFIPSYIETFRAQRAYSKSEIVNDINTINSYICQLEYDSIPHRWDRELYVLSDRSEYPNSDEENDSLPKEYFRKLDSTDFKSKIVNADSVVHLTGNRVAVYNCPEYRFLSPYSVNSLAVWKSSDLYRKVLANFKRPNEEKMRGQLEQLLLKYSSNSDARTYDNYYNSYEVINSPNAYRNRITVKYKLQSAEDSINNIIGKQNRWSEYGWEVFLRMIYYFSLGIAMLLFLFRHLTPRTFFLSLLTGVLLSILTTLILAVSRGSSNNGYILMVVYYLAFIAIALTILSSKVRSAINGIALSLLFLMTPFMPLLIMAWYYDSLDRAAVEYVSHPEKDAYLIGSEIGGWLLLVLMIEPVFKFLLRKWWAKPVE